MNNTIDYDDLEGALRRCGSNWVAAQAHGLLCGRLAVRGTAGASAWRDQVLENLDANNALRAECETLLDGMLQITWQQLGGRQSDFDLMLPGDDEDAGLRTQAIADWCEGFLHGLVADQQNAPIRERLAQEPLSDLIRDMLEITRATVGDEDDDEDNERAYVELVEYIRVAAQLAYEELADLRDAPAAPGGDSAGTLH